MSDEKIFAEEENAQPPVITSDSSVQPAQMVFYTNPIQPTEYNPVHSTQQNPVQSTVEQKRTSLPLISLIFGLGGFFFYFVYSVPAIIFGLWGRHKAKKLHQSTSTATAGIILGILSTAMWAWITYNIMSS